MYFTILLEQLVLGYLQNQNQAKIYISQQKDLFISHDPLKSRTVLAYPHCARSSLYAKNMRTPRYVVRYIFQFYIIPILVIAIVFCILYV